MSSNVTDSAIKRLVLLGPPGAGKGTQAERLASAKGLVHVSTGDLLRAAVAAKTSLGTEAKGFMDRGELVPDSLVVALVRERLEAKDAAGGFLLDGFPRNVAQAKALETELVANSGEPSRGIQCVVHMKLDDDEVVRRLLARGRADDTENVIRNRLEVYRKETTPLIAYYEARSLLCTVDASGTVDEVEARIHAALEKFGDGMDAAQERD